MGATSPDRSPGRFYLRRVLIMGPQQVFGPIEIRHQGRGATHCRHALLLTLYRGILQNAATPKEQYERYERRDRNHNVGDDTEQKVLPTRTVLRTDAQVFRQERQVIQDCQEANRARNREQRTYEGRVASRGAITARCDIPGREQANCDRNERLNHRKHQSH